MPTKLTKHTLGHLIRPQRYALKGETLSTCTHPGPPCLYNQTMKIIVYIKTATNPQGTLSVLWESRSGAQLAPKNFRPLMIFDDVTRQWSSTLDNVPLELPPVLIAKIESTPAGQPAQCSASTFVDPYADEASAARYDFLANPTAAPHHGPADFDPDQDDWVCQAHGVTNCTQEPECIAALTRVNH